MISIQHEQIADFAFVTDGIHTSIPFDEEGKVKVISAKHPKSNYFDLSVFEMVSNSFHEANPRTALSENDVIVSTVGTIGNSATVDSAMLPANSDRHVGIIRIKDNKMLPLYLSTFLNSEYGRFQSFRESTGNVQLNLFISKINTIIVPRFSDNFENVIAETVKLAHAKHQQASNLTTRAETLLLSALGLEQWQPPEALSYERSAKEVFGAERLDAEYFQPSKMLILEATKKAGAIKLSEVAHIGTGFPWKSEFFLEGSNSQGRPFVRIRDCKPGRIDVKDLDTLELAYAEAQNQPITADGDIVIGMDGLKYFYASQTPLGLFVNQRVVHLSPNNPDFSSEYLLAIINSPIGQLQLLRQMTVANTVGHITLEHVRNLEIPVMSLEKRQQITELVASSAQAKAYSTQLLDLAKRAVEMAIEESEAAALAYLAASIQQA